MKKKNENWEPKSSAQFPLQRPLGPGAAVSCRRLLTMDLEISSLGFDKYLGHKMGESLDPRKELHGLALMHTLRKQVHGTHGILHRSQNGAESNHSKETLALELANGGLESTQEHKNPLPRTPVT